MNDKKSPLGYLAAGIIGAAIGAASVLKLANLIPQMMTNCMKKMKEEGIEPPECCKEMMGKRQTGKTAKRGKGKGSGR